MPDTCLDSLIFLRLTARRYAQPISLNALLEKSGAEYVLCVLSNADSCNRVIFAVFNHLNKHWKNTLLKDLTSLREGNYENLHNLLALPLY